VEKPARHKGKHQGPPTDPTKLGGKVFMHKKGRRGSRRSKKKKKNADHSTSWPEQLEKEAKRVPFGGNQGGRG